MAHLYHLDSLEIARHIEITADSDYIFLDRMSRFEGLFPLQDKGGLLMIKLARIMTCCRDKNTNQEINKVVPFFGHYCWAHLIHAINFLHDIVFA